MINHGCLVDGSHGIYGITRVIRIAESLGWDFLEHRIDEENLVKAYEEGKNGESGYEILSEAVTDIADRAELWLDDNIAPEGSSFGWHDGEFFLWSDESWEIAG